MWIALTGVLSRVPIKVWVAIAAALGMVFLIDSYKSAIKDEIYNQFYAQEIERQLAIKDNQIQMLTASVAIRDNQIKELVSQKHALGKKVDTLKQIAANPAASDGDVAPVLRDVIEALR